MIACSLCGSGCASAPYLYGRFQPANVQEETPQQVVFEYGTPHKVLDKLAWVVALPTRILPMHPKINSHTLSPATTDKLKTYLEENDLSDVLVRVNQYDPAGEWRRLKENTRLAPGWRYTFGTASLVGYTVLPGRVFGGDLYNPFTNTLYVNSDVAAMLIVEAAYAKDLHTRTLPGTYAAINEFPVLTLWRYTLGVNDTLGYSVVEDDWELERETYRTVYPLMGIHAALGGHSAASMAIAMPNLTVPLTMIGGAVVGHTVGQTTIAHRERQRKVESNEEIASHKNTRRDSEANDDSDSGIKMIGFEEIPSSETNPGKQERRQLPLTDSP